MQESKDKDGAEYNKMLYGSQLWKKTVFALPSFWFQNNERMN